MRTAADAVRENFDPIEFDAALPDLAGSYARIHSDAVFKGSAIDFGVGHDVAG